MNNVQNLNTTFLGHIAATLVLYLLLRLSKYTPRFHPLVWFIGSMFHELSHFLFGIVFFAKPYKLSLWPRNIEGSNKIIIGEVYFSNLTWWNQLQVGLAPLILLPPLAAIFFLKSLDFPQLSWPCIMFEFLAVQSLGSSWPSSVDWNHALKTILLIAIFVILVILLYLSIAYLKTKGLLR